MLTSLGRSGSSWTTHRLGLHPQLLAYRPYVYEPRLASYWLQIARTPTRPASYLQALGTRFTDDLWWLGRPDQATDATVVDDEIERWLGAGQVEASLSFGVAMTDEFYRRVATLENKPNARFFVEKFLPNDLNDLVWEVFPDPREIVLVRDFRDVFCSILAFNQKRGYAHFGRQRVGSDEEFVSVVQRQAERLLTAWRRRRDRAHLVRYEDLVLNGRETVAGLLSYLGIDRSPPVLDAMIGATALAPDEQARHGTSADHLASVGRWRRELSPSLQTTFGEVLGPTLAEFGYDV